MSDLKEQDDLQHVDENLRVWDVAVHYPNLIYIFTNRGFVIFKFEIDLSNEQEILSDPIKY